MAKPHAAYDPSQEPTEAHSRGVLVKIGSHRLTIPLATIGTSIGAALLAAWGWIRSERADLIAADTANAQAVATVAKQLAEVSAKQQTSDVILADIRNQLARIDARVAEIQVVLMQGHRP